MSSLMIRDDRSYDPRENSISSHNSLLHAGVVYRPRLPGSAIGEGTLVLDREVDCES